MILPVTPEMLKLKSDFAQKAEEMFQQFVCPVWYEAIKDMINHDSFLEFYVLRNHEVSDDEYPKILYPNIELEEGIEKFSVFELCALAILHYVNIDHENIALGDIDYITDVAIKKSYDNLSDYNKAIIAIYCEEEGGGSTYWALQEMQKYMWHVEEDDFVDHLCELRDTIHKDK